MIVTSNSKFVIDCFSTVQRIVLSSLYPGPIPHLEEQSSEIIRLTAFVSSNKPVIFLDGSSDETFVRAVFPFWSDQYQLIPTSGRWDVCKFFIQNFAKPHHIKVVFLRDKEFFLPELVDFLGAQEEKEVGAPVVRWVLPCIESYLILSEFLYAKDPDEKKKMFCDYAESLQNSTKYFMGVTQGLPKLLNSVKDQKIDIGHYWREALNEITQPSPNWEKVVQVIHGHTWYTSTTPAELTVICKSLHPSVVLLLKKTHDKVEQALNKFIE